jgi:hypothetical protein
MKKVSVSLQRLVFVLVFAISFWISISFATGEEKMSSSVEGFNVECSADNDGNITYTKVGGKAGVGISEEEAKANLSPIQIGKDPSGKSLLFFEQKKPYRGVRRIYLDAFSGLRLHPAMDSIFAIGDLETKTTTGDKASLEKVANFLSDKYDLVRLHAAEAVGRIGDKNSLQKIKAALSAEKNKEIKLALEKAIKQIENRKTR